MKKYYKLKKYEEIMKKLFLIVLLFLAMVLTASAVGQTVCAPIENGKIPDGTLGKKFNPGHYVVNTDGYRDLDQDARINKLNLIIDDPQITGIQIYYSWKELEPTEGNYDFSTVQEVLDIVAANDKHLSLYLVERNFWRGGCVGGQTQNLPQYMVDKGIAFTDTAGRCMPKMWESYTIDRYIALINALGDEFNDHPYFESIALGETALANPNDGTIFPKVTYRNNLIRIFDETSDFLSNTVLSLGINYLAGSNENMIHPLIERGIFDNQGALSWPDAFPGARRDIPVVSQTYAKNNKNKMLVAPHADTTFLKFDDTQEVYEFYVNELGASHIIWKYTFTNKDDGWIARYYEDQILPIANNPVDETCPETLDYCLDTSSDCTGSLSPENLSNPTDEIVPCGTLHRGNPAPLQYGQNYDVDTNEIIFRTKCSDEKVYLEAGLDEEVYYTFSSGYVWRDGSWNQIDLDGNKLSDSWIRGIATGEKSIDTSEESYALTYICKWTGTKWKCGCHDSSCSQPYWNLQVFRK